MQAAVQADKNDFKTQLTEAEAFLNASDLILNGKSAEDENPYANKDGLIEFICGIKLSNDPVVRARLIELRSWLLALTSIATSYVNRYAQIHGPEFKTDAELWALALSRLPLLGASKPVKRTYSAKARGVEIAPDLVSLVLDIVPGEGPALDKFRSFLEQQGQLLRSGVESNKVFYKTLTLGISVEVMKMGDELFFLPKIKQYRIDFTKENSQWSSSWDSKEEVSIDIDYTYGAHVFDYEALQDPAVEKEFQKFINRVQKADIEDAGTFFNDEFNTL